MGSLLIPTVESIHTKEQAGGILLACAVQTLENFQGKEMTDDQKKQQDLIRRAIDVYKKETGMDKD